MAHKLYIKRVGKVMETLLASGNPATFTPVSTLTSDVITGEDPVDIKGTLKILSDMGHIELKADENGNQSYMLLASGAALSDALFREVK